MKRKLAGLAVLLAMVAIAMIYTAALAGDKVVICHYNLDDPLEPEWVTIEVSVKALPAHLAHGDVEGACLLE